MKLLDRVDRRCAAVGAVEHDRSIADDRYTANFAQTGEIRRCGVGAANLCGVCRIDTNDICFAAEISTYCAIRIKDEGGVASDQSLTDEGVNDRWRGGFC